jgi:hypothetical protein
MVLTRLLAIFALVVAAGTVGVLAGRTTRDSDAGWQTGYRAGVRAERAAEKAEATRIAQRYREGQPGYTAIYAAGRREGQRLGRKLGRSEGLSAGRRTGFRDGRSDALPSFSGGWRASHWYLVKVEPGASAKSVRVGQRVAVTRGRLYGPCANDPDNICAAPKS